MLIADVQTGDGVEECTVPLGALSTAEERSFHFICDKIGGSGHHIYGRMVMEKNVEDSLKLLQRDVPGSLLA